MNTRRRMPGRDQGEQAHHGRTVVVVLVASLGAVLMAFVLGINVGQERAPAEVAAPESHVLRTLDSQAARLRQVRAQERTELSFHDALTGPARAARPQAASAAKPTPAPAVASASQAASAASTQEPVAVAELAPAVDVTEPGLADEAEPAAAPARFSLQVGAFPDEGSAAGLRRRLQDKGYQVRIATSEVEGRGTWYRVRVGSYTDRGAAESTRAQLSSGEGLFALVVPET